MRKTFEVELMHRHNAKQFDNIIQKTMILSSRNHKSPRLIQSNHTFQNINIMVFSNNLLCLVSIFCNNLIISSAKDLKNLFEPGNGNGSQLSKLGTHLGINCYENATTKIHKIEGPAVLPWLDYQRGTPLHTVLIEPAHVAIIQEEIAYVHYSEQILRAFFQLKYNLIWGNHYPFLIDINRFVALKTNLSNIMANNGFPYLSRSISFPKIFRQLHFSYTQYYENMIPAMLNPALKITWKKDYMPLHNIDKLTYPPYHLVDLEYVPLIRDVSLDYVEFLIITISI